jgi:peptidoglycan/LPS O-acetylase OafA/YrhL
LRVVEDHLKNRDNNFGLIRLVAAIVILFWHSFFLTDPAKGGNVTWFGIDYSNVAVDMFFAISGFLLAASYLRNSSVLAYAESRFLRIFPGLFVCNLVSVLIVGLAFTQLPSIKYLADHQTWEYVWTNSTLISGGTQLQIYLPGVFDDNMRTSVNGPLWTLAYEIWMYILLAIIGLTGILKKQRIAPVLLLEGLVILLVFPLFFFESNATRLLFYFFAGVFVYLIRKWLPMNGWLALALGLGAVIGVGTGLNALIMPIGLVYCTIWMALVPEGKIRLYNRVGDYSYGTYLYGWPVQQSIIALAPTIQPLPLFGSSLLLTLLIAAISWHFIENPSLRCKGSATRLVARVIPANISRGG